MLPLQAVAGESVLKTVDWLIIAGFIVMSVVIGLILSKRARSSSEQYFKGGGGMPWWLLGTSMAATTFAADTPLALAGWVVTKGIAQNWYWWSMVPVTMMGVFFFARLWKRANPLTDMEFVYQRYSGGPAHTLRIGKALWLALPYGCLVMGWVTKAMTVIVSIVMPDFPRIPIIDGLMLAIFLATPLSSNVDDDFRDAVRADLFDPIEIGYHYGVVNYPHPYMWTEFENKVYEVQTDDSGEVISPARHDLVLEKLGLSDELEVDTLEGVHGLEPSLWAEGETAEPIGSQEIEGADAVRPVVLADGTIVSYSWIADVNAENPYTLAAGAAALGQESHTARTVRAPLAEMDTADFLHNIYLICSGVNQYKILFMLFLIVIIYTAISGLWGVMVTDFIQFWIAMGGCILLAILAVNHAGGMEEMLTRMAGIYGPDTARAMVSVLPTTESGGLGMVSMTEFWIFILLFWWSFGFTDGGSYFAQRMLSAKDERNAALGYLWYAVAHYALRMWPWLIVGFAAAVAFPHVPYIIGGDPPSGAIAEQGYVKIMVEVLGSGLLGLLVASLLAAYMSTISTQVNLGASYLMNDVYRPFIAPIFERRAQRTTGNPDFKFSEKHFVRAGILLTVFMAFVGIVVSLFLNTISGAWFLLAGFNAGIGVIYILRWYWWRVSAWTEIVCLLSLLFTTIAFKILGTKIEGANLGLPFNLLITVPFSVGLAMIVTSLTKPTDHEQLKKFYRRVQPGGPGWREIEDEIRREDPSFHAESPLTLSNFRAWLFSIATVYLWLGGIGMVVVGDTLYPVLDNGTIWMQMLLIGFLAAWGVRKTIGPKFNIGLCAVLMAVVVVLINWQFQPFGRVAADVPLGLIFTKRFVGVEMLLVGVLTGWVVASSFSAKQWSAGVRARAA